MKIEVNKKLLGESPETWLRRAGYAMLPNREGGQDSFARRFGRDFYPRFHIYFSELKNNLSEDIVVFNIHLDQKKPGYAGQNRHNAEYDGQVVENEVNRLKSLIMPDFMA